jgi:hypothetical protein
MQDVVGDLEKGGQLELLSDARRHVVIQMVEEYPSRIPELPEVRAQVQAAYNDSESLKLARKAAEQARTELKAGKEIGTVAVALGTTVTRPEAFNRSNASESLGFYSDALNTHSRSVRKGEILVDEFRNNPAGQPAGVALVRVVELEQPNRAEFRLKLPELTQELRNRKRQAFLNDQLAMIRRDATSQVQLISPSLTERE